MYLSLFTWLLIVCNSVVSAPVINATSSSISTDVTDALTSFTMSETNNDTGSVSVVVTQTTGSPPTSSYPTSAPNETSERSRGRRKNRKRGGRGRSKNNSNAPGRCVEASEIDLKEMLGPSFNGRYMSVEKPIEVAEVEEAAVSTDTPADEGVDTAAVRVYPFAVGSDYSRELPPDYFLNISWYQEVVENLPESAARLIRYARSPAAPALSTLPWQCESEIIWTDLGSNYYPRFLRNIRCTRDRCWYGHFKCRPRAFTVNVLKRVRDSCKKGRSNEEEPQWVYEERAVTFCCECVGI